MAKKLSKYFYMMKISIADSMVYAFSFLGRSVFFIFIMLVYLMLWRTIYSQGNSTIAGFNLNMIIWYLIITEIVTLSNVNITDEVSRDVKSGNIAYLLNKPYSYIGYSFSTFSGRVMIKFVINAILGIIMGLVFVGSLEGFNIITLPLVTINILLGIILNFAISFILALTAFWVEENAPFRWIYQKLVFTLGGMLLPIDMFPEWLRGISEVLPFAFVTYGPAKLAIDFSIDRFVFVTMFQGLYTLVFILLIIVVYKKGVRALNVNGG